ncbi:MAG: flagellar protein FlgN [Phycisphaerales bacterium]|nr:flagellar protein FlgN [Phycisphaerales bacterium]
MNAAPPTQVPDLSGPAAALEGVLRDLVSEYEQLLELARGRDAAIRRADVRSLAGIVETENAAVQRIAEIEKRRVAVVGSLAERLGSPDRVGTPVSWLEARMAEPVRSRIAALAQRLRDLMDGVLAINTRCRQAAEMLSSHMEGLLRAVTARLNHSGTYGRRGLVEAGVQVVSAVDLRS